MVKKKLKLSNNKVLAGVCGGVAEYFNVHPLIVRILFVLFTLITLGGGAIVYLITWIIMFKSE